MRSAALFATLMLLCSSAFANRIIAWDVEAQSNTHLALLVDYEAGSPPRAHAYGELFAYPLIDHEPTPYLPAARKRMKPGRHTARLVLRLPRYSWGEVCTDGIRILMRREDGNREAFLPFSHCFRREEPAEADKAQFYQPAREALRERMGTVDFFGYDCSEKAISAVPNKYRRKVLYACAQAENATASDPVSDFRGYRILGWDVNNRIGEAVDVWLRYQYDGSGSPPSLKVLPARGGLYLHSFITESAEIRAGHSIKRLRLIQTSPLPPDICTDRVHLFNQLPGRLEPIAELEIAHCWWENPRAGVPAVTVDQPEFADLNGR